MTTETRSPAQEAAPLVLEKAAVRNWKPPIALGLFALAAVVLFIVNARPGFSTFRLATEADFFQIPPVELNVELAGTVISIALIVIALVSGYQSLRAKKTPVWLISLFAVLFVVGFLAWASAGGLIPVPGLLIGALSLSVPLIFGALGGVISERSGVINIAIEGQLLAGAFTAALVGSITGQVLLGILAAMVAGVLVSFVLAAFAIKYFVDQVIVGVVLNVLVLGLTSFFYSTFLSPNGATLNSPPQFDRIDIPVLSQIPILGPVLFRQTIIVYLMYIAVAAVWFGLFKTRWGLRLRSVGEHPQAADTVGINVTGTRFWNVSLAGAVAGLGGAFYSLAAVGSFQKDMTAGAGFIALAAVIFGRWNPIRATLAALLFGFATNLQSLLGIIGSPVPSEFMLMLPYVVTIFAVAGLVGHVRGPAAANRPYVKS